MRVLVTTPSGLGHIHPMVPLARALAARGHDVLWAAPSEGVEHVQQTGLPAVATGSAGSVGPAEARKRYPEIDALPPEAVPEALFAKLFGTIATPPMLAALVPVAQDFRPDLVVADAADFAGHIVAAELGVPSVTKGFGPILPAGRVAGAGKEVAPLWRERGLEPRPYGGAYEHLYLDIYPPILPSADASHIPHRQLLRPVTEDGPLDAASPLPLPDGQPDEPLVYVTMGTVFNDPEPLRVVLTGLAAVDIRVLVTVGPKADPAILGPQPAGVRIERYVAQTRVLPHCDVVVSHAGSGTVLATLALGLPQLCLPQGADQFLNADAVASAGAGISLRPGQASAAAISEAVSRVLGDGTFRDAAGRASASIAAMPAPADVAGVLEDLAGRA